MKVRLRFPSHRRQKSKVAFLATMAGHSTPPQGQPIGPGIPTPIKGSVIAPDDNPPNFHMIKDLREDKPIKPEDTSVEVLKLNCSLDKPDDK